MECLIFVNARLSPTNADTHRHTMSMKQRAEVEPNKHLLHGKVLCNVKSGYENSMKAQLKRPIFFSFLAPKMHGFFSRACLFPPLLLVLFPSFSSPPLPSPNGDANARSKVHRCERKRRQLILSALERSFFIIWRITMSYCVPRLACVCMYAKCVTSAI